MSATITITARKIVQFKRVGARRPLSDRTEYTCEGPDGRQFKNTNKAELLSLLRRRYGRGVVITLEVAQ